MRFVIFFLFFSLCNESFGALEKDKNDPKVLLEKAQEIMNEVNKINSMVKELSDSLKDIQNSKNDEIKTSSDDIKNTPQTDPGKGSLDDIKTKPYTEPSKNSSSSMNSFERQHHYGESMQLFHQLQGDYHKLQNRFADLKVHSQEVKDLKDDWVKSNYDKNIYAKYLAEHSKYNESLNNYNKDLDEHREMKKKHDEMKKTLAAK